MDDLPIPRRRPGGKHAEPAHFGLMMACSDICGTAAQFMMIGIEHRKHACRASARGSEPIRDMQGCMAA